MFESISQLELVLPALAFALGGGALWSAKRVIARHVFHDSEGARQLRSALRRTARQTGLEVDAEAAMLHGRIDGWRVEITHQQTPIRGGSGYAEEWNVCLYTPSASERALLPPSGLGAVRSDAVGLRATVPLSEGARLPELLSFMARNANPAAPTAPAAPAAPLARACLSLELVADPVLPRWEGTWRDRHLLVEQWGGPDSVHIQVGLRFPLPHGFWVGSRHPNALPGPPLTLPPDAIARGIAASTGPGTASVALAILDDATLLDAIAAQLACNPRSFVSDRTIVLARSTLAFVTTPMAMAQAAEALALLVEASALRPWHQFATDNDLSMLDAGTGEWPTLSAQRCGFALRVRRIRAPGGVELIATPLTVRLARGLRVEPGAGAGPPTGNPILDQCVSVTADEPLAPSCLASLPADALLPLLLESSHAELTEAGIRVVLSPMPSTTELADSLHDLERVMRALPHARIT